MKRTLCLILAVGWCHAQEPAGQAPPPASKDASSLGESAKGLSFLGATIPSFDPSSEIVQWDGKRWNINDNRIFEARFEKFLNAPEATPDNDLEYNRILARILDLLAPNKNTPKSTDEAFHLLSKASQFDGDARLCDGIANQVEAARIARQSNENLIAANWLLEKERKRLEWNSKMTAAGKALDESSGNDGVLEDLKKKERKGDEQSRLDVELQPMTTRLAEVNALLKANQLKREVSELQVKVEFQALIVQHFLQRRFQHVLIGTQFYRCIFSDGDSLLRVGEDAKNLFSNASGFPPTVGTLDSLANEALRDVREGVRAFLFLLKKNELESATRRLAETFVLGEFVPEIRTLPRADKQRALDFLQKSNQLISAIDVKDYSLAEKLTKELKETAKDFDTSKPLAAIETARTVSAMHLAKAKNAATSGDKPTLEAELKSATEIWPRNPALTEVGGMIFSQTDLQQRAITDFDQLLGQKNYRQIYDDKMKFIAATAMFPEKQEQLRKVLEDMALVEAAIIRAQEVEKRGDFAGAWESAESAYRQFPEDNKLNQVRANLTTRAPDFVRALRQAEEQEKKDQLGSSLAWYLKAQKDYPASDFARQGIERINTQLLPDGK
ncbi:MAG: hypothetical protein NTV93_13990 [Verrucomicrobia bacterium]|nr:hypothetical protein [Verrucomicrobiota bacterium]